jgi:3-hydroxyisobutyrate dehydrogenase-like beta-hydroxyacid dehydrogenase
MQIGFVGLGIMGWPMAQHLVNTGHLVVVWTNNLEKRDRFARENKVVAAATPAELAAGCDVIFLCVGDTAMSRHCILGPDGLLSGAAAGTLIVDCSTISPIASKEIA